MSKLHPLNVLDKRAQIRALMSFHSICCPTCDGRVVALEIKALNGDVYGWTRCADGHRMAIPTPLIPGDTNATLRADVPLDER